ncbi:MAG: hypothetical protein ACJAUH_001749 [Saprospiraceae bacterium]|jgi:hypothetical protein
MRLCIIRIILYNKMNLNVRELKKLEIKNNIIIKNIFKKYHYI